MVKARPVVQTLVCLVLTCLCVGACFAQSGSGGPNLRATARIVYVDLIVRDSSGRIVHGLKASDFVVTEDKQPQRVSLFEEHVGRAAEPAAATSPLEISNLPASARGAALNMVLLDLMDTPPLDQAYARKRMIEFLRKMPPHEQVALFVLSDRLHMIQGFSTDSAALAKAAAGIDIRELNRLRSVNRQIVDLDTEAYLDRNQTNMGSSSGQALEASLVQEDVQNMKVRLEVTATAFHEIARAVNGFAGRKNLFWLAGQFPSAAYYDLGAIAATATPILNTNGITREDTMAIEQRRAEGLGIPGIGLGSFEEIADKAVADSQIAVYPISLAGVQTDNVGASANGLGTAVDSSATAASTFFTERQVGRSVMTDIAENTGGEAFFGNNDPAGMLQRGFEDADNYYELAYQPTNHDWNGKFRSIHVSAMKGAGLTLSYRRGYFALPEQPPVDEMVAFASAMRIETPPSTQLVLRSTPPTAGKEGEVRLRVKLDLPGIGFTTDGNGDRKAKLQVMTIAYPVGGEGAPVQSNQMLNIGLTVEDYKALLPTGVPFQQALSLQPGRYAIRIGILDLGSGRVGTLTLPYTTPGL